MLTSPCLCGNPDCVNGVGLLTVLLYRVPGEDFKLALSNGSKDPETATTVMTITPSTMERSPWLLDALKLLGERILRDELKHRGFTPLASVIKDFKDIHKDSSTEDSQDG